MFRAVKQKAWVRRNVERRLCQAVILKIHAGLLAEKALKEKRINTTAMKLTFHSTFGV
jgi:hypothetical protein